MEPIKMPSGAELKITLAPFADSKALYQAILEEVKHLKIDAKTEIDANLFKDLFCYGFSSIKVEKALEQCMKRCLLNGIKIDKETFEPEEFRQDYLMACIEIAKANVMPFLKPLLAQFSQAIAMTQNTQGSK
jgi:hypothetical protein